MAAYKQHGENVAMTVKDAGDHVHPISILQSSEAKEMLGVSLAPDRNHSQHFTTLKSKMAKFAELIRVGHVTRHESWLSLNMMTLKSLEYSIPAMTFTKEEYQQIMSPVLKHFLPKAGINRNIPRDLLYAPASIQGFDLKDPFIVQGIEHTKDITEHL